MVDMIQSPNKPKVKIILIFVNFLELLLQEEAQILNFLSFLTEEPGSTKKLLSASGRSALNDSVLQKSSVKLIPAWFRFLPLYE